MDSDQLYRIYQLDVDLKNGYDSLNVIIHYQLTICF